MRQSGCLCCTFEASMKYVRSLIDKSLADHLPGRTTWEWLLNDRYTNRNTTRLVAKGGAPNPAQNSSVITDSIPPVFWIIINRSPDELPVCFGTCHLRYHLTLWLEGAKRFSLWRGGGGFRSPPPGISKTTPLSDKRWRRKIDRDEISNFYKGHFQVSSILRSPEITKGKFW